MREDNLSLKGMDNILVIGGSRQDRIQNITEQLLLDSDCNMVISDYKGLLFQRYKNFLEGKGYKVSKIDLRKGQDTMGYNIISNAITPENPNLSVANIDSIADSMIRRSIRYDKRLKLGYRINRRAMLSTLLGYVGLYVAPEFHDFKSIKQFVDTIEDDAEVFDCLFTTIREASPESFIFTFYNMLPVRDNEKMISLKQELLATIDPYLSDSYSNVLHAKPISLAGIANTKQVLFLCTDKRYDPFIENIISQLLTNLLIMAENSKTGKLRRKVKFLLDDYINEIPIADMNDELESMRRKNITVACLLGQEYELTRFEDRLCPRNLIEKYDAFCYMGGHHKESFNYVVDCLGSKAYDVFASLDGHAWLVNNDKKVSYVRCTYDQERVKTAVGKDYVDMIIDEPRDINERLKNFERIGSEEHSSIRGAVKAWLERTSFMEFHDAIYSRVKGQSQLDIVLVNIYNYLENISRGTNHSNNIIIAAPSGCGKTETYRALRDYFEKNIHILPVAQADMAGITEEGYKGKDISSILSVFDHKNATKGEGIVFLDEFDKKLMPSCNSLGDNMNFAVQSQLLTLIEGKLADSPSGRKVDTNLTMFIALGAFDLCREKKSNVVHHIGFGAENEGGMDHYCDITREDMIELGASYEMLGRFSTIVNYQRLSYGVVDEIIGDMAVKLGNHIDKEIRISKKYLEELHKYSNTKYGCRFLESKISEVAMNAYMKILKDEIDMKGKFILMTGDNSFDIVESKANKKDHIA